MTTRNNAAGAAVRPLDAPPMVTVAAFVEVRTNDLGSIDTEPARAAVQTVNASGGPAIVIVRGCLGYAPEAARIIGAALWDATHISVLANGPGAVQFAALIAGAAVEEQEFHPISRPAPG